MKQDVSCWLFIIGSNLKGISYSYFLECRFYYLHEGRGTEGGLMVPLQMASYKYIRCKTASTVGAESYEIKSR
jgi:hypothetical protein